MSHLLIAFIVKPFFIFALFGTAFLVSKLIMRFIPEGKIKKALSTRDDDNH